MLSITPDRLGPNKLDSQFPIAVVSALDADVSPAADVRASGLAAVRVERSASCPVNPRSSARAAVQAAIVGMTAPSPFTTEDSDSPVCPARRVSIAGVRRSLMLSNMDAMEPSLGHGAIEASQGTGRHLSGTP